MRKCNVCATGSKTRRLELQLIVSHLDGLSRTEIPNMENYATEVQIEWQVPRRSYLSRRAVKKNCTSKQCINSNGCVRWNEGFDHNCKLKLKDSRSFRSWMINLEIHGFDGESNGTATLLAKLGMDIAEFADPNKTSEKIVELPVSCCIGGSTPEARLTMKINCFVFQAINTNTIIHPLSPTLLLPSLSSCVRFQNQPSNNLGNSTSESDEDSEPRYRSLVATNLQIEGHVDDKHEYCKDKNWEEDQSLTYQTKQKPSLIRILSWNNRRLSLRAPDHPRDAPLLKKAYGEDGGDDIDYDRRCHLSLSKSIQGHAKYYFEPSGFGGSDRFEIGSWEKRKLASRDGNLELVTDIFLASIDQRNERASGDGACTVLAVVIADWLHQNPEILPLRCQFDKLIREGSLVWRNLCKEETNREKFSDQHLDLDTVLQAQARPLMVIPEKSYVGFFDLENIPNQLQFLHCAMSFDSIWDELQYSESTSKRKIYIVSWNDHFFVLKIEDDVIYAIDTLGERLFEGCTKAYILRFNRESKMYKVQPETRNSKKDSEKSATNHTNNVGEEEDNKGCQQLICEGKTSCKEFIKGFLAALPLRQLHADIKKGITGEAPLHHLLQIEFHYTTPFKKNSAKHGEHILMNQTCKVETKKCTNSVGDK